MESTSAKEASGRHEAEPRLVEPLSWLVSSVRGRRGATAEPGLPALAEVTLVDDDGRERTFGVDSPLRDDSTPTIEGQVIACARTPVAVSQCLICRSGEGPWTNEHLPPKRFGGRAVLATCSACNNGLGSRTEAALLDRYDQIARYRMLAPGRPEPIAAGRAGLYTTTDGEVLVQFDERWVPDRDRDLFAEYAARGEPLEVTYDMPRPAEYLNAALKQAFLAACLLLGGSPAVASADEIRAELLAARDAPRRADVELGPRAQAVGLRRTGLPAHGPAILLVRGERDGVPDYVICLAGTLIVEWPFPDAPPHHWMGRPWPWSLP